MKAQRLENRRPELALPSTAPAREPWSKLPEESAVAFAAFRVYRDLPVFERSLRHTAKLCNRHVSLMERWSKKHAWVARASAWDEERDRAHRQIILKDAAAGRR